MIQSESLSDFVRRLESLPDMESDTARTAYACGTRGNGQ